MSAADPLLAVDARCLGCGAVVLRIEADPGEGIELPDHECGA